MGESRESGTPDDVQRGGSAPPPLSDGEFAGRLQSSYRVFWLIAMSIVRDSQFADDVVQEAALIGLRKRSSYKAGTNFDAWIGTIVRNVARNRARKERRIRTSFIQPGSTARSGRAEGTEPSVDALSERQARGDAESRTGSAAGDTDAKVRRWLDDVGEVPRACLVLRTIEGLDYAEISRLLEIPEGTAMSHVHRTRRFLRQKLISDASDHEGEGVSP